MGLLEGRVRFVRWIFFFFFSILSGMVNSRRGLAAAFRDGFRKGLRLNFFAVDWAGKEGEWIGMVNLLGDFLILKLCDLIFRGWCGGRQFWGCNFLIVYSLMKLWRDYSNIFLKLGLDILRYVDIVQFIIINSSSYNDKRKNFVSWIFINLSLLLHVHIVTFAGKWT